MYELRKYINILLQLYIFLYIENSIKYQSVYVLINISTVFTMLCVNLNIWKDILWTLQFALFLL